jgi:HK97 family phage prohead protease
MKRAYGLFEVKDFDEDKGILSGVATSIRTDRMEDVVEPSGGQVKLPLIMLSQHDSKSPVGHVIEAKTRKDRIDVVAKMVNPNEARSQTVKERLLAAWDDVRLHLTRGFSIGFNPIDFEPIKDSYGYRFKIWEWLELSIVTIPANAEATIQTVKSLDTELRAASGQRKGIVRLDDHHRRVSRRSGVVYLD